VVQTKGAYHHGDLKEALVQSAYVLVARDGAENFALADACRLAGVSTAAPYKHFRDRNEVLELVLERAFDEMDRRSMAAVEEAGVGTLAGIIAMGHAYIRFAVEEQRLFRLMFGQHPVLKKAKSVEEDGAKCFGNVIELDMDLVVPDRTKSIQQNAIEPWSKPRFGPVARMISTRSKPSARRV